MRRVLFAVPVLVVLAVLARPASAQLRPIGPMDWELFEHPRAFTAGIGMGWVEDQHASLAGTRGDLLEVGQFRIGWRSGRVGLELAGTLYRRFQDEVVLREPATGALPPTGEPRHDAGDVLAFTAIRLTNEASPLLAALRFGTRLPTTSNEPGLERDRTDFFAGVGGVYRINRVALLAESGVGILGTRISGVDQLDVLTFSAGVEWRVGPVVAGGYITGQDDVHDRVIRGNEDLSELRLGVRGGDRLWFRANAIRGIAEFSPPLGFQLMFGFRR